MGEIVAVRDRACDVHCFKMPYKTGYNGTTFESEDDTIFYDAVCAVNNTLVNVKVGRQFLWKYELDS